MAATCSTSVFNRKRAVEWSKLKPLLLSSLPGVFIGGLGDWNAQVIVHDTDGRRAMG